MSVRERTLGREGAHRKNTECDLNGHLLTQFYLRLVQVVARAPEHDRTCMTRGEVKGVSLRQFKNVSGMPSPRRPTGGRLHEPGV